MTLPPMPPWEGFHVLVVHFPVALLLVAPLLMLLAMFLRRRMPGFGLAAWIVLLLGTIAAWVAVASGQAAFLDTGEMPDAARAVMVQHGDMGEIVRDVFTGLCLAYGAVLLAPVIFKRVKPGAWSVGGTLVVLAVYAWAAIYLANTAHLGGTLVHQYGIRAALGETATDTAPAAVAPATTTAK